MSEHTKETCLEDIKRRILALQLPPGSRLDEASLTEYYAMSRTPMREVLHRLAGAGLIEIEGNRGAKVASMDFGAMRVFFQTAPSIYAAIGQLAAENRTEVQLSELKSAQEAFEKATGKQDAGAAALANHEFHAVIGRMAHNPYLLASLDRLLIDHTRLSQTFYRPSSGEEVALIDRASDHHRRMINALEARDATTMADLTMEHWDLSKDRVERFVHPDPLPLNTASSQEHDYAV